MNVLEQLEAQFHKVMDWVKNELHGQIGDDARKTIENVTQAGKQQISDVLAELGADAKADLHQIAAGAEQVASDVAGDSASSDTPTRMTSPGEPTG